MTASPPPDVDLASAIEGVYTIRTSTDSAVDKAHRARIEILLDRATAENLVRHNLVDGADTVRVCRAASKSPIPAGFPNSARMLVFQAATLAIHSVLQAAATGEPHSADLRVAVETDGVRID